MGDNSNNSKSFEKLVEELKISFDNDVQEEQLPEKCDKYYISEIAFTMGWINTLNIEKLDEFLKKEKVGFKKVAEFYGMREECHIYIGERGSVMIVMTSGLVDSGNMVMFCNTPKKVQLKILKEIARQHFEDFIKEVRELKDYWKKVEEKTGGLKVINPTVYSVSKRLTEKDVQKLEELITKFLNDEVRISSIKGLKRFIKKVNKIYYKKID